MIDQKAVNEFKELYYREFKIELTNDEAVSLGMRLIKLVKAVYGKDLPEPKKVDKEAKKEKN